MLSLRLSKSDGLATICAAAILAWAAPAQGRIDFDGNGVSDLWEHGFSQVGPDENDDDGDGTSNRDEGIAGTDPTDRTSSLDLEVTGSEEEVVFSWIAKPGKNYRIEHWNQSNEQWEEVASVLPVVMEQPGSVSIPGLNAGVFRLGVSDVDADGDGLTAWEEFQLGTSDTNPVSGGDGDDPDFLAALRRLESPEGITTTDGVLIPRVLPDDQKAARFLISASFGPTDESIARVKDLGFTGWIDEQMELHPLTLWRSMQLNGLPWSNGVAKTAWWRSAIVAQDQLRQRVAYALSQILVVNTEPGTVIGDNAFNQLNYYDIFVHGAFGPYRHVLERVTYSPIMGFYLSHLNNRKADDPVHPTRFPDENFAREIMQLFTIGLWELNPDGSRKTDAGGLFIPTYDNSVITEMAKVFTGMSHSTTNNGFPATSFFDVARGNDFHYPMKVWDEEHEPGPKNIINGVFLDGSQTGEEEVQATLDALMAHQSMAPFLGRLLIQRFTSSNPSPSYLSRVSAAWNRQTDGQSGNLGEVMKAILLDPEVLNPGIGQFAGKVREPIIRYASLARAFDMAPADGRYNAAFSTLRDEFGQYPTEAPSVFNFYSPDFAPEGVFREEQKVSPELQLSSLSQQLLSDSRFQFTIEGKRHVNSFMDYSDEQALAGDVPALVDRVDLLLTGGRLSEQTKATIVTAVESETFTAVKTWVAIYLVSQSMEAIVWR